MTTVILALGQTAGSVYIVAVALTAITLIARLTKAILAVYITLSLAHIALWSFDKSGKAFTLIGCHTLAVAAVWSTDGLATQLRGATITSRAFASTWGNTLLMRATCFRAMGTTEKARLLVESIASLADTSAI